MGGGIGRGHREGTYRDDIGWDTGRRCRNGNRWTWETCWDIERGHRDGT